MSFLQLTERDETFKEICLDHIAQRFSKWQKRTPNATRFGLHVKHNESSKCLIYTSPRLLLLPRSPRRLSSSDNLSSRYQITLHQEPFKVYWNVSSFLSCNTTPKLQPKQPMSRFLAWSVRFITKIQKWIFDPQRRWIPWIISKTGHPGYMIRSVSLLRTRKEWILPAVTRKNFNI